MAGRLIIVESSDDNSSNQIIRVLDFNRGAVKWAETRLRDGHDLPSGGRLVNSRDTDSALLSGQQRYRKGKDELPYYEISFPEEMDVKDVQLTHTHILITVSGYALYRLAFLTLRNISAIHRINLYVQLSKQTY